MISVSSDPSPPDPEPTRRRLTARVILLDDQGRILLMKGRSATDPHRAGEWFTVGGGVKPGETLEEAARREIHEESGIAGACIGPVLWSRELPFTDRVGQPVILEEFYLVARCAGGEPCRDRWTEAERRLMDDIRWWTGAEVSAPLEPLHPANLPELLVQALAWRS